jgi:four helix bundle protein
MANKRFEDLNVWRRSAQLCENVFLYFSSKKCYQFKDQISRTALSISSNIAKGFERDSDREFIRFLIYAKGSFGEFRSQTIIDLKINYIDTDTGNKWREESIEISSMLSGLIRTRRSFLKRDLNKQK